jgi:hypothetical protein
METIVVLKKKSYFNEGITPAIMLLTVHKYRRQTRSRLSQARGREDEIPILVEIAFEACIIFELNNNFE